ncbi:MULTISPECIES: type I restriction enzyme HsdR N-terminal domain-containing protein [unclassified Arcicella]|nr:MULTISPECIES: type I restriction enzyme HsdR N-terminal domain-containing protein [unclassified Arcicella]
MLTPEEWVRQHFVHFLINHYHYPKSLIKLESSLKYNTLLKRTDIQVFGRDGKLKMIIECKAPYIPLSQQVFSQVAEYNQVLKAEFLTITNGMVYHCCKTDWENMNLEFLKDLPLFV